MWFKNLFVFAFTRPFSLGQAELEALLNECMFTPCASTEMSHFGFVSALGKHSNNLVHEANGHLLVCARREEKILPAPVIKDLLDDKIEQLEVEQSRNATKKEKEQFKEDIIFELLPRAFSRTIDTHAYINAQHNIIVVNTSSRSKAEDLLALLRKAIGTLPVTSISPETAPDEVMTEWLIEKSLGEKFELGMEAELNAIGDDAALVKVKNQDLFSDEVRTHLDADKYVTKVSVEWDESLSCVLGDDMSVKRIKFYDVIQEQNDDIDSDDALARLDADFTLMCGELNRFIDDLFNEFGVKASDCLDGSHEDLALPSKATESDTDPFYQDAVLFIKEIQMVSISKIQRKFRIGYNRAARIVENMETKGVISPAGNDGSREVLAA